MNIVPIIDNVTSGCTLLLFPFDFYVVVAVCLFARPSFLRQAQIGKKSEVMLQKGDDLKTALL